VDPPARGLSRDSRARASIGLRGNELHSTNV
jgi:hypothetical protein